MKDKTRSQKLSNNFFANCTQNVMIAMQVDVEVEDTV